MQNIFVATIFFISAASFIVCLFCLIKNTKEGKKETKIFARKKKNLNDRFFLQEAEAVVNNHLIRQRVLRSIEDDYDEEDEEF